MKKSFLIVLSACVVGALLYCLPTTPTKALTSPDLPDAIVENQAIGEAEAAPDTTLAVNRDVDSEVAPVEKRELGAWATQPPRQPDMTKIDAFREWTERWAKADEAGRTALREEGAKLAQERREEFKALIVTDPRRAFEAAVPRVVRQDLPADIVAALEKTVATSGEYITYLGMPSPGMKAPERKLQFQTFEANDLGSHSRSRVFRMAFFLLWLPQSHQRHSLSSGRRARPCR